MKRRLATICVVALVLLSGCSILGGSSSTATPNDQTPTPSPASTPTQTSASDTTQTSASDSTPTDSPTETATSTSAATATQTETPTPTAPPPTPVGDLDPVSTMSSLPPGVSERAVTNATALYAAHESRLEARAYRLDLTFENSSQSGLGRLTIANDTRSTLVDFSSPGDSDGAMQELSVYLDAEVAGTFNRSSGEITHSHGPAGLRFGAQFAAAILSRVPQTYVTAPAWTTAGVDATDDGEQRLVLHADALRESEQTEDVQSVDGRMELTADGLVRALELRLGIEGGDGTTHDQRIAFTVDDAEANGLAAPDWVSEPPQLRATTEANDELLVVEHTGGAAIEAGTNLTVSPTGTNVTLDRRVTEGDTLYVHKTGDGFVETPHLSIDERPTLTDNATAFSGRAGVSGSVGRFEFAAAVSTDESDSTLQRLRFVW